MRSLTGLRSLLDLVLHCRADLQRRYRASNPYCLPRRVAFMGEDFRAGEFMPQVFAGWLQTVGEGVRHTEASAPLMFYRTAG